MDDRESSDARSGEGAAPDGVGDALRTAVERTLSATAGSASETRQRAQGLLDDVVRRGQEAREEVARRGESATARLTEVLGELRAADDEDRDRLEERLEEIERRLAELEGASRNEADHGLPDAAPSQLPLEQADPER